MKLSGSASVTGSLPSVFDRILDPEVLAACIPGCERMERNESGSYETCVKAGVGAVKGSFNGVVTLSDVVSPERYRMAVEGKSTVGYVKGGANIRLEAEGEVTLIHYEGEATVSGLIASVGGRLVSVAAKNVVKQFFTRLAAEVEARGAE